MNAQKEIKYYAGAVELDSESTEYIVTPHYLQYNLYKLYEAGHNTEVLTATVSEGATKETYQFDINKGVIEVTEYSTMTDSQLASEVEFLLFEDGRIARGHAHRVKKALAQARAEMHWRGFKDMSMLRKHLLATL